MVGIQTFWVSPGPVGAGGKLARCVYLLLCGLLGDSCGPVSFCALPSCSFLSFGIADKKAKRRGVLKASKNSRSSADCSLLKVMQAEPGSVVGKLGTRARFAFLSSAVAISVRLSWTLAQARTMPTKTCLKMLSLVVLDCVHFVG